MSQFNLTCPHCGFSKTVDRQQVPAGVKKIKCPKCQQSFVLEIGAEEETFQFDRVAPSQPARSSSPALGAQGAEASEDASPTKFCANCGRKIHVKAEICPGCGVRVAPPVHAINKLALLLITFFLGGLGGHKFYQKKYLLGVLYLIFFWTYIPALVSFVEFIIYAIKSESELQQRYPEASGGAIVFAVMVPVVIAMIGILAAIAIPQFAAYREKAFSAAAKSDLRACKTRAEAYFAEHRSFPTRTDQLQCQASKGVALYYLSLGNDKFQIISFHDHGKRAFLVNDSSSDLSENTRQEIESQISQQYGRAALDRSFHFME